MAGNNGGLLNQKTAFESPPIVRISPSRLPYTNRKLSFPASLHASLLGLPSNSSIENRKDVTNAKRRFSNVGDVVSRKLSNTIGWRSPSIPPEEVILQGRMLCSQYIKYRLKRSGIFNKKLGLYRLRSLINSSSGITVREVSPFLIAAGAELERMYPKLYTSISRQATASPGGVLVSDKTAAGLLAALANELLKTDITWGKVVSVFAIAGGLAVDCVCQGHPEYLHGLMEGMTEVLEDELAVWIAGNGGWNALCAMCRCPKVNLSSLEYGFTTVLIIIVVLFFYFVSRFIVERL